MKKVTLINIVVIICLLIFLEILARTYIFVTRGNSTAGLVERNLNLRYEPFVMYGPNWSQVYRNFSKNLNKNEELTILLVGGSTAQGFPAKILENKISKKLNKKINVLNSGYGGYISTQELILITKYANIINPDLIINLNTANDILHSLRDNNKPGTFFLNNTYENILTKPFFAPIIYVLQHSQLFNGLLRLKKRSQKFHVSDYEEHIDILIQNINNIYLYCKGANIPYLNVMQPHVIFKNIKHENEVNFNAFDYRSKIVEELYNLAERKNLLNNENFLDSRLIFQDNSEHIFSDDVHFIDDKGYHLLAESISKKVLNLLQK